ncbi:peroxide stress protein YaaA, partial [Helicobacter japonicus]|uniref:peroxide stress protein YaaA n=1 Tax=Helicobacter japonicus TaxID=425400 RepID=UPI003F492459
GILWLVTAAVLFFYRLNRKRYNEIMEDLKNGKKVSHYAKFYRGIYARAIAQKAISHLDELLTLEIENLHFCKKEYIQNATILTYEVLS